jgi:hypothetical protein
MPTIRELQQQFRAIEKPVYRGGTYPEELAASIRDVRNEVESLRKLVGDVIGYLDEQEAKRGDFIRPDPASYS